MRIIMGIMLLGAVNLALTAASAQPDWQPFAIRSVEAWVIGTDENEPYGTLTLHMTCQPDGNMFGAKQIELSLEFPEMEISDVEISIHEPVLVGDHRMWRHRDGVPAYLVEDEYGLQILMDDWTRSDFAAPYVLVRRGNDFALLQDGPSEYEMFSKLRPLPVSANISGLHVLNYDEQNKMLYLIGAYYPNGALFKAAMERGDPAAGTTPPGAIPDKSQHQIALIGYDTSAAKVEFDYMSPHFRPLYIRDSVIYGTEDLRVPFTNTDQRELFTKLETRSCTDPATTISSQVLALRDGEGIEMVYPWKTGELLVITLRSVYRYVEATGELTYLLDLVLPAQQALAQAQAEDQASTGPSEN